MGGISILSGKQVAVIFILAFVPFAFYTNFRTDFRGFDSYAFFAQSCGNFAVKETPYMANIAIGLIPCNILSVKAVLFCLFFVSLLGIASMGSLFHEKKGWMAALFSFLSPSLFFTAAKFENDSFAVPFLIWSAYFFYKARKTKQPKYDACCIALVCIAALFWYGSVYWLLAFAIGSILLIVPGLAAIAVFRETLLLEALPRPNIVEAQPFVGIVMVWGLALGFALIPAVMVPQLAAFLVLGLMQLKFAWFMMPLLSVGLLMFYVNPKLDRHKAARFVKGTLLVASICMVVVWGLALQGHPPGLHHWQAIDYAIQQSEGGEVWNDWDLGYWIMFRGGKPSDYGGGSIETQEFGEGIVLTVRELDCELLREFENLKVWQC